MYRFPPKIFCTDKLSLAISFEYFYRAKKGPPDLFVACLATQKTLNHPIFIGNSRFFIDLHDKITVQILMRTVRLCVHLSCNFSCEIFIFLFKTFTCLETNESLNCHVSSILFCYLLYVFSYCKVAVLNVYLV